MKEIHPIIISASRRTDIPAFFMEKLIKDLKKGYVIWKNPFNPKQTRKVLFDETKLLVFWTKYPSGYLRLYKKIDIPHYFLFTLNYYPELERRLPAFEERVKAFIKISEILGKDKIIWRFDPIVLIKDVLGADEIISRFKKVADKVARHTNRVIISFMTPYKKAVRRLNKNGFLYKEPTMDEIYYIAERISSIAKEHGLEIQSCSERYNEFGKLEGFGIARGACIDKEYILKVFKDDKNVIEYVKSLQKDKGQRKLCNCIESVDIGEYGTCRFECLYCYAI